MLISGWPSENGPAWAMRISQARHNSKPPPMAVPVIMQIARENTVHSDDGDILLSDMEEDIIRAANVESIH